MGSINQISANRYPTTNSAAGNDGDDNLYKEKLVFTPAELGIKGKLPQTIVLTERQVETKIFKKYGFDINNAAQREVLKLRFDTLGNPADKINWVKRQICRCFAP